ncbi:DNA circularization N-terminal domain-containing protein [Halomonas sp.]|uniref:DNA circularization protein n=1 Tax=Halomonas sp. TaxID=1486246 RepID=UPI00257A39DE|nr:DNA circularization N-terminal domain-containing protein [Halomonas sp.]MCJ8285098.1 DNA circularization N-terminal domain-containing protein [Halomonas sp.]NQY70148.1 DNA circularization N-terminal domain-containing protein [Halomonas sp.]
MSWRERIDPELRGSFRGVGFHVERADTQGGRRWLVHEYPRRDRPYTEDMGRKAREWRLAFFVAGDDYDRERDALIEALDAPGAATLVHPYLGTFSAVATDPRWSESTRDGGVCSFQVTFVESGLEAYPATTLDTQREVRQAADLFELSLLEDFAEQWSIEGLLGWSLVAVERDLTAIMRGIDEVVGGIADEVASVIRFPTNIAGIVLGGYNRLRNAVMRPIRALDLYDGGSVLANSDSEGGGRVLLTPGTPRRAARLLRETGTSSDSVTPPVADTPERIQRAQNTIAARQLNGRAATLTAARLVAETDWVSRQDAEAAGNDTLALIDAQMTTAEPISDAVYTALVTLRAAVSEDLRTRAVALPGMTSYTPQRTLPALVVAHRLYGDATRADEIAVRNNVPHPGALRGGIALEVLSE